ncbi:recombinase RecT, partial [Rhodopseudomonas parapalustris]
MSEAKAVATTQQERNITDGVLSRVQALSKQGDLLIPKNYSAENALKSAWLILQGVQDKDKKPALEVCTKESIANSLMDMVVQGLNPVKKQCYFVVYGSKLTLMRSYMGTAAVTKRLKGVKDVFANVIYEGDEFAYELDLDTGLKKITKHEQSFENIDPAKIKGAYAVVVKDDGQNYIEVMNIGQIRTAWSKSRTGGSVHKEFSDEMAKKTVINRACKMFINTSDDSDILLQDAFDRTDEEQKYDEKDIITGAEFEVNEEIEKAPKKEIKFEQQPHQESKVIDV